MKDLNLIQKAPKKHDKGFTSSEVINEEQHDSVESCEDDAKKTKNEEQIESSID